MVAPLGEKARLLEKDKASGAYEGLEPLSTTGTSIGSSGEFFVVDTFTLGEEAAY